MLSTVLTAALPLVVRLAERLFGRKTGPAKKNAAVGIISAIIHQFAGDGVGLPTEADIANLVETSVAALNSAGALKGTETTVEDIDTELLAAGLMLLKRSGALKGGP